MPREVSKKPRKGPHAGANNKAYPYYAYISRKGRGIQPTFTQAQAHAGQDSLIVGFESERESREFILTGAVVYNDIYGKVDLHDAQKSDVTCVHMEVRDENDPRSGKTFHVLRAWSKPQEPMHKGNLTSVLNIPPPVTYPRLLLYAAYLTVDTFQGAERPVVIFRDVLLYRALKEDALKTNRGTQHMHERLTRVKGKVCWVYVPDLAKVINKRAAIGDGMRSAATNGLQRSEAASGVGKEKEKKSDIGIGESIDVAGGQPDDTGGDTGGGSVQEAGGQDAAVQEGGTGSRPADLHAAVGGLPE